MVYESKKIFLVKNGDDVKIAIMWDSSSIDDSQDS